MNHHQVSLSLAEALMRAQEAARERPPAGPHSAAPLTIAISREAGAYGSAVGEEVGRRLGWPVYDSNLLEEIAEKFRHRPSRLEAVDERPASWLEDVIGRLV